MAAINKAISDEDYWSSSAATKIKSQVNIFDESVDFEAAKKFVQNSGKFDDDDEDVDTINWEDCVSSSTGVGRVEYSKSARYKPGPAPGSGSGSNKPQAALPPQRPTNRPTTGSFTGSAPEPSIDDIIRANPPRQPTLTEVTKLEAEVHRLKLQLEASRKDKFVKLSPKETVTRIIYGQPYSLEMYKSKEDKITLLDEAIKLYDGNAITAIVLFIKSTLRQSLFNFILMRRPVAIEHHLSYLRQRGEWQALIDQLSMLGRSEEAAMIKYKQAVSARQPELRIKNLRTCYTTHFQSDPNLGHDAALICEQISLLERQLPVEDADAKAAAAGDERFRITPKVASIVGKPVLTTLYYCCLYHYGISESLFASPAALKKEHHLTDRQFVWTAMRARGKLHRWQDVEQLFQAKGWFGTTKMKAIIGFDKVVVLLSQLAAPREVLNKYCSLIDDSEHRLEVAGKYNCHETIIETYKALKDRQALEEYTSKLKTNSQEWFYAKDVLKATTIKWKN